jgi:hypothetical protein
MPRTRNWEDDLLTLGELETFAGAGSAGLFSFNNTCISCEEASSFESCPMFRISF